MLTYATIAAGAPSGMGAMTRHMLTQTVPKQVADLARYYTRGMEVKADEATPRRDMHPTRGQGARHRSAAAGRHRRDQRPAGRAAGGRREDRGQALCGR